MNDIFIDVDYDKIYKHDQEIGGDVFLLSKNPDSNQIVATLSDGLGSGVKANVLASLTAQMAHKLSFSDMDLTHSDRIIMNNASRLQGAEDHATPRSPIVDIRYPSMKDISVSAGGVRQPSGAAVLRQPGDFLEP
jgi:hypothetical protein